MAYPEGRRTLRVAQLLNQMVAQILREDLTEPDLGFLTLTRVDVSGDLRHAAIHYSVYGDEAARRKTAEVLERVRPQINRWIGARIRLRYTPRIHFEYDPSPEKASQVMEILERLHGPKPSARPPGAGPRRERSSRRPRR